MQQIHLQKLKNLHLQNLKMHHALYDKINVHEMAEIPVHKYIECYQQQVKFIRKDLFQMLNKSTTQLLKAKF